MTNKREWTHVDKSDWGEGPWQSEPDKVQWVDEATGLDCLIVRNNSGGLCGYVGVGPEHPAHGRHYYDDNAPDVRVHGSLTFTGGCDEGAPEGHGICHIAADGRPDNVWWFGFDCGHLGDLLPGMEATMRKIYTKRGEPYRQLFGSFGEPVYRDRAYVERQIAQLAQQLHAIAQEVNAVEHA